MDVLSLVGITKAALWLIRLSVAWALSANLRQFKTFVGFRWFDSRKIRIVVAETYPKSGAYDGTTCSGIRATGEGQVYALFYLLPWLARAYGSENIELTFANGSMKLSREQYREARSTFRMVILGGPIHNNWARAAIEFEQPQFRYGTTEDPHLLIDMEQNGPIHQGSEQDYALVVQAGSDDRKGFDLLLLSGNTTKGTAAAAAAVTSPALLKEIISKIEHDSKNQHPTSGGCFYIKTTGAEADKQLPDIRNSKYGKLRWS